MFPPTPTVMRREFRRSAAALVLCSAPLALLAETVTPPQAPVSTGQGQEPGQAQAPQTRDRPFLGLQTEPFTAEGGKKGLRAAYIYPFSAAAEMGFELGDEIVTLNDVLIDEQKTFIEEVQRENPGAKLRFQIRRQGALIKVQGKIGSYTKTMTALQDASRKELMGKPLPPPPAALWWNTAKKTWEERPAAMEELKGKVAVVFSFDNCQFCREQKLKKIAAMKSLMEQTAAGAPLAFMGIYFSEVRTKEENLKDAESLLGTVAVSFPLGVAYYPSPPGPDLKSRQVLLHQHGVAILEPKGTIVYLQTFGALEQEFLAGYQNAASSLVPAKAEKPGKESAAPKGDKAPGR